MKQTHRRNQIHGQQVQRWRTIRGLSQDDVAHCMGVTLTTVIAWETLTTGIPLTQLVRLAAILNVPLTSLLNGPDDRVADAQ